MKGGNTYNITILSLHIENPQALPQTCLSHPGVSAQVTLPAMTGQPAPIICADVAHLSSLPLPVIFWNSSKTELLSQASVLGVLPHYLSMATAATEKQSTSYANEKRPQMSAVTTSPFSLPT